MDTSTVLTHTPKTFIIVLNWKNAPDTIECLESVFKLGSDNFQVVVCDNASPDDSVSILTNWLVGQKRSVAVIDEAEIVKTESVLAQEVVLIRNDRNYGYAGGNNRGLRYSLAVGSRSDYVWIINNDATLDGEALNALLKEASGRPEVGLFGSTILSYSNREAIQTQGGGRFYLWLGLSWRIGEGRKLDARLTQAEVEAKMSYITGAAIFTRLSALSELGLMEESYFLYFEDVDWAVRARRLGIKLGYAPASLVYHKEGATVGSSTSSRRKSVLADYYGVRNRLALTRRLFPWALPTVYLAMLITLAKRLLTGQFDRVWMVLTIMFGIAKRPT